MTNVTCGNCGREYPFPDNVPSINCACGAKVFKKQITSPQTGEEVKGEWVAHTAKKEENTPEPPKEETPPKGPKKKIQQKKKIPPSPQKKKTKKVKKN